VPNYIYNSSNELTSNSSGSYTYDANGNTLSDPSGKQYTWDFGNRLTQAVVPGTNGGTTTFKYDPFGRRIQKSGPLGTTNYLYDGFQLIEDTDQSGNVVARYTNGQAIDQPLAQVQAGTTSYYQQDALSSTTSLSNATAALANTYTYDSFGKLVASTGTAANPFQYTGREFDSETGAYFYRTRYFDPAAGRFISEDPIRFSAGVNFYAYVQNSPISLTDPFGMASALDGIVAGLGNIFPGSEFHPGPNGDAVGSWLVVHMPCSEVYKILEAQGYQTAIFPPFNNPFDHSGGWEFRTYGPGFHYRVPYPPLSLPYPTSTRWPDSGSSSGSGCPNASCTIDQFHIDDPNPLNGVGDAWGHFKKFLAGHGITF
jgi:RHS repeat-associated protein